MSKPENEQVIEAETERTWNMVQDLMSVMDEAGMDVIHADAINILDDLNWDYEAAVQKVKKEQGR